MSHNGSLVTIIGLMFGSSGSCDGNGDGDMLIVLFLLDKQKKDYS